MSEELLTTLLNASPFALLAIVVLALIVLIYFLIKLAVPVMDNLDKLVDRLSDLNGGLEKRIETLESNRKKDAAEIAKLTKLIADKDKIILRLQVRIGNLETAEAEKDIIIEKLKREQKEVQQDRDKVKAERDDLLSRIEALEESLPKDKAGDNTSDKTTTEATAKDMTGL